MNGEQAINSGSTLIQVSGSESLFPANLRQTSSQRSWGCPSRAGDPHAEGQRVSCDGDESAVSRPLEREAGRVASLDAGDALRGDALEAVSIRMRETSAAWCITDIPKRRPGQDLVESSQIPTVDPLMARSCAMTSSVGYVLQEE